jgi:hypothetical protein
LENLALACPNCNGHKWAHQQALDGQTGQIVPLFNPRIDAWEDHFRHSPAHAHEIEGITAIGRATVALLRMNDEDVVTIRRLLSQLLRRD